MIKQLRIDDRLIHGQITTAWSRVLGIDAIVVANDEVANDELSKKVLMMAKPDGIKVVIKSVDDAIKILSDPKAVHVKVLVLVDNPRDALLISQKLNISEVNVGNFTKKVALDKIKINDTFNTTAEDLEIFKNLTKVCRVYNQLVPSSSVNELETIINTH